MPATVPKSLVVARLALGWASSRVIPFSAELWSGIEEIYAAILSHPFLTGLTDGSLEREAFQFYVVQDAHYLREYARAVSLGAAFMVDPARAIEHHPRRAAAGSEVRPSPAWNSPRPLLSLPFALARARSPQEMAVWTRERPGGNELRDLAPRPGVVGFESR